MAEKDCPRCGESGEIDDMFGWRKVNGKKIPQSHCGSCRGKPPKNPRNKDGKKPEQKKVKAKRGLNKIKPTSKRPAKAAQPFKAEDLTGDGEADDTKSLQAAFTAVAPVTAATVQVDGKTYANRENVLKLYREHFPNDKAGQLDGRGSRSVNFMLKKLTKKGIAA